jgi:hypothetical protein
VRASMSDFSTMIVGFRQQPALLFSTAAHFRF